ncbi:MAG: hypothetical protein ACTHQM_25790 [Thermoanaerobaculia bacterium]
MSRNYWRTFVAWLLGILAVALPLGAFVYVGREAQTLVVLEKVGALFVSWPYVVLVLTLAFFLLFRDSIGAAIARVQRVKGLGGELELQVQAPAKQELSSTEDREQRAEEIEAKVVSQIAAEEPQIEQLPDEVKRVLAMLDEPIPVIRTSRDAFEFAGRALSKAAFAKEDAQRWKFHYLSAFLVPQSKLVLRWFKERKFAFREDYEVDWAQALDQAWARATILSVLVGHRLLEDTAGLFSVTREGADFLSFLETSNAWHQTAIAPAERPAFYTPVVPTAPARSNE